MWMTWTSDCICPDNANYLELVLIYIKMLKIIISVRRFFWIEISCVLVEKIRKVNFILYLAVNSLEHFFELQLSFMNFTSELQTHIPFILMNENIKCGYAFSLLERDKYLDTKIIRVWTIYKNCNFTQLHDPWVRTIITIWVRPSVSS